MKIFALIFLSIASIIAYLIGSSFIGDLSSVGTIQTVAWMIHLLLISTVIFAPFLSRLKEHKSENSFYHFYQWSAYHLMGFYFILIFLLLLKTGVSIIVRFPNDSMILSWTSIILSIVLSSLGFWNATKEPTVIKVKIKLDEAHQNLKNLKLVQLSDVHVSSTIKKDFVEKIVGITNSLNPDLIMLTGDFIDGHVSTLRDELTPFLNLKSNYGSFYVPGNHEYYWGVEEWLKEFKKLNFNVLINESKEIMIGNQRLSIGGVHDLSANRMNRNYKCDPEMAFSKANPDSYKILLAHQPKTVNLIQNTQIDLVLSGHTHAGQFFPASLLIYLFQPYVLGLHKIKNTWLYVNQGTGYWGPPNRLGTKSEITLIEFT